MAKVDIQDSLKKKIEDWLAVEEHTYEIPTLKAFVNKACYRLLKIENKRAK